jgi:hydroxyacylglutathione hydrolase
MLFRRIESEGLAHYSHLVGDRNEAFVIDPRRDCDVYIDEASKAGYRIAHVFETHRNEDFVVGSVELAARTGAEIWHADGQLDYRYGGAVKDGQTWKIGGLKVVAIATPGHTLGSVSYLLHDHGGNPWVIFSGDTLFAGDVGRVDLPGLDRVQEMANLLYESLFQKLLPLGDHIIVCPSHGAGSVCGESIADRAWTTIGLERRINPKLQFRDRKEFVERIARKHDRPPYFLRMEKWNLEGAPILGALPVPTPLPAKEFGQKSRNGLVLDTRAEVSFGAAHVPGALSIWLAGVPAYAGWFMPYDRPVLLVHEISDPSVAVRYLIRMGFDNIAGSLAGGMLEWHAAGLESRSIRMIPVQSLCEALDREEAVSILDIRSDDERNQKGRLAFAQEIPLTQIPGRMGEVLKNSPVFIFCGTGLRSMVAASLLEREGWQNLVVVLGGLAGWKSTTCPIV